MKAFVSVLIWVGGLCLLHNSSTATQPKRPKLVVAVVVDQMRWDYLYRYEERLSKGGFKHLLKKGFKCQQATINYLPSFTACGHASIFTGSVPAIHGITGNEWIENSTNKRYCTSDSSVKTVGSNSEAGQMSPKALLTTTIGDELKLATNFRSKVIGIALKDRGAILPAGHSADAAYWFDELKGNWISSSYYLNDLPQWVKNFNAEKLPEKYLRSGWQTLYPLASYRQSAPDYSLYEGVAGVYEIDTVMKLGMAHPMGPLQLADFIGLDTCLSIMNVLHMGFGNQKYAPATLLANMVQAGYLGVKSGEGFYKYTPGSKELVISERFSDKKWNA